MEPTIALVFSPERWVETLHRHLTDHGGARVRQIVLEPALALADEYDTLVVSALRRERPLDVTSMTLPNCGSGLMPVASGAFRLLPRSASAS